jgi:hypothetical protein
MFIIWRAAPRERNRGFGGVEEVGDLAAVGKPRGPPLGKLGLVAGFGGYGHVDRPEDVGFEQFRQVVPGGRPVVGLDGVADVDLVLQ